MPPKSKSMLRCERERRSEKRKRDEAKEKRDGDT